MKLKEAISLKSRYKKLLSELQEKRQRIAVVTTDVNESWEAYLLSDERVDIVTADIDKVMSAYLEISALIRRINNNPPNSVLPDVTEQTIADMVDVAAIYRAEAKLCATLGNKSPRARDTGSRFSSEGNPSLIKQTTYDIKAMAKRASELEQKALELSAKVDELDIGITVEYEDKIFNNIDAK